MLQYVAVCCHLWRCVFLVHLRIIQQCSAVQCSAVRCSMMQYVAVCGSVLLHLQRCVLLLRLEIRLEKLFCRLLLLVPVYGAMLIPSRNNISRRQEMCAFLHFCWCKITVLAAGARAHQHERDTDARACTIEQDTRAHTHIDACTRARTHALGVTY